MMVSQVSHFHFATMLSGVQKQCFATVLNEKGNKPHSKECDAVHLFCYRAKRKGNKP